MGAWHGPSSAGLLSIALLTMLAVPVAAQDDAGIGADAPNDAGNAVDVPLADIAGVLAAPDENDFADWFRVPATPGKGLLVVLDSPQGGVNLEVLADDFQFLGGGCCGQGPGTHAELVTATGTAAFRIGVSVGFVGGPYVIRLTLLDLADLFIENVTVVDEPLLVAGTPLAPGAQKTIHVTIANQGAGTAFFPGVNAWITQEHGGQRNLGGQGFANLAPGASTTVTIPWDSTGELGDVWVNVDVGSALEADPGNNNARARHHVLAGNVGTGVDLLANDASDCDPDLCFVARTSYDSWQRGAFVNWASPTLVSYGDARAGTEGGRTHVAAWLFGPVNAASLDAGVQNGHWSAHVCPSAFPEECVHVG